MYTAELVYKVVIHNICMGKCTATTTNGKLEVESILALQVVDHT